VFATALLTITGVQAFTLLLLLFAFALFALFLVFAITFIVLSCFILRFFAASRFFCFLFTSAKLQLYFELTKKNFIFFDTFLLVGYFTDNYKGNFFSPLAVFGRFEACKKQFLALNFRILALIFHTF